MFDLKKKKKSEVCIERWVKNHEANRIVSLMYRHSPNVQGFHELKCMWGKN